MAKKKLDKKTAARRTGKEPASKKPASKKPASKAAKQAAPAKVAEETTPAPKAKNAKHRAKKTTAPKATKTPAAKPRSKCGPGKGKCASSQCSTGTCTKPQLDGRSLLDRARNCQDLEECRKFILEFNEAVEQANRWLDDMHNQALSAEQARDLYGEQISDLLEAIDIDRARIAALEADLEKARTKTPKPAATDAVLGKLAELNKEVQALRADLQRVLEGRPPKAERRQRVRKAARAAELREGGGRRRQVAKAEQDTGSREGERAGRGPSRKRKDTETPAQGGDEAPIPSRQRGTKAPGAFPKYSVLRGAACSLGVGKYGYPPEVCAPASFSRSEAAEILGTYAQNKYSGLAKWAVITGLPIDDIAVPLVPLAPRAVGKDKVTTTAPRRRNAAKVARTAAPRTAMPRSQGPKAAGVERSNKQILDQVLLTVARI
jgi:hypothetical protein